MNSLNLLKDKFSDIKPPFPPHITVQEIIRSTKENAKKIPNTFLIYRMAFTKELKSRNISYSLSEVSIYASLLWKEEPEYVKNAYKKLEVEAKLAKFEFNTIQDAHLGLEQIYSSSLYQEPTSPTSSSATSQVASNRRNSSIRFESFNDYNNGNFLTTSPLQQEYPILTSLDSFTPVETSSGRIFIEHRLQTLEQRKFLLFEVLKTYGINIDTGL
ncbi:hypothetical protein C1645_468800 [Glomus cerebriforme]|uniref:HMG box domain-containing protein n=1 Tax=Glomus cerebriforme TaxID=658196 RepID=A0A397SH52_9GLOM|nr:hypothetical protein C1645_468800 [Glomus cerebriforme]